MDLDPFLNEKSTGLGYPLRNHLKAEKEIEVSVQNTSLNVTITMVFKMHLKTDVSLPQLAFNFSTPHTPQTQLCSD